MASPQVEDGYTRIANEVIEHLYSAGMNGTEWDVVMLLIRETWGWKQKSAAISIARFVELTCRPRNGVRDAIKHLKQRGILLELVPSTFKRPAQWQVNKDWESWGKPRGARFGRGSRIGPLPEVAPSEGQLLIRAQGAVSDPLYRNKENLKKVKAKIVPVADAPTTKTSPAVGRKRKTGLAAPFLVEGRLLDWTLGNLPDINLPDQIERFCDHHRKVGSLFLDWDAAWRTWVRNIPLFTRSQALPRASPPKRDRVEELRQICEADEERRKKLFEEDAKLGHIPVHKSH